MNSEMPVEFVIVFVTCGSAKEARRIAKELVRKRLAACANMIGPMKSVYRWKGKVESAAEVLMVIKSTRKNFAALEKEIRRLHSYDTPEIIALPIVGGSKPYMKWLLDCTQN